MSVRLSSFNIPIHIDGKPRLFNTRQQQALSAGLSTRVLRDGWDGLSFVDRRILAGRGFAVNDAIDERDLLYLDYTRRKNLSSFLSISLIVSYRCNCACPDCFQRSYEKGTAMCPETREGVARMVEHAIEMRRPPRVVVWYSGGEPLACPEECLDLSDRIGERCARWNVPLFEAMTTNATLAMSPRSQPIVDRCRIFYVSLSESEQAQAVQRPFANGRNSYRRVIDAIPRLAEGGKQIIVRFNLASVDGLEDRLRATMDDLQRSFGGEIYDNLFFEFSALVCFGDRCLSDPSTSSDGWRSLMRMTPRLERLAESSPWPRSSFRLPRSRLPQKLTADTDLEICDYLRGDGFVVVPSGEAYACTTKAHDPDFLLGNVRDEPRLFRGHRLLRIVNASPFEDPQCAACPCLPMCLTTCPLQGADTVRASRDRCRDAVVARITGYLRSRDAAEPPPAPVQAISSRSEARP